MEDKDMDGFIAWSYDEGYRLGEAGEEIDADALPEGADRSAFEHGFACGEKLYFRKLDNNSSSDF